MKKASGCVFVAVLCVIFPLLVGCQTNEKAATPMNDHVAAVDVTAEGDNGGTVDPVSVELVQSNIDSGTRRTMVIDGRFDDWDGIRAWSWEGAGAGSGPEADADMNGMASSIDLDGQQAEAGMVVLDTGGSGSRSVSVAYDDDWVYLRVGLGGIMNAQGLSDTLSLVFDADGNPLTGVVEASQDGVSAGLAGVDFVLEFSPLDVKSGRTGGTGAFSLEQGIGRSAVNPYDLEVSFLPTYADNEIEMRLRRGVEIPGTNVESFADNTFSFQCLRTSVTGSVTEHTKPVSVMTVDGVSGASAGFVASGDGGTDGAFAGEGWMRKPAGAVRVMSWNIEVGHLFDDPRPFARVIGAIRPDVICFQEMGRHRTGAELRRWLEKEVPVGEGWDVRMRIDGDVAIATKLASVRTGPMVMPAIEGGKYPVRAALLLIGYGGKRIVVSSVHLKCCGRAGDKSDKKRIAETQVIGDVLASSVHEDNAVGVLVMGDFNLVGSRTPLDILIKGADLDGSDLRDIAPRRLYDGTSTTWRDRDQPYLPGRLDFALVSDSTIRVMDSFVFDSLLLSDGELEASGVLRGDCAGASDHLPIVVDLKW